MAQHMLTPPERGFIDPKRTASGDSTLEPDFSTKLNDNSSLDTALLAIGGCYTQAYIDKMTQNDKVYAIRQNVDPASVK